MLLAPTATPEEDEEIPLESACLKVWNAADPVNLPGPPLADARTGAATCEREEGSSSDLVICHAVETEPESWIGS